MGIPQKVLVLVLGALLTAVGTRAEDSKVLTNHVRYERIGPKRAVVQVKAGENVSNCSLKRKGNDEPVLHLTARPVGPVQKWKDWTFWTIEFDSFQTEGVYYVECRNHNSDAAPWWQGENARLASLAAAARLASSHFMDDAEFSRRLEAFGANQLNWILGLNPFDACMLYGVGCNNVDYLFFDSWEFTNAPGGISNGITGGLRDEEDIDFNLTYKQTGADNDWRWQEQWLPHDSWYLLAVSAQAKTQHGK
jgi:hypothetical protein